MIYDLGFTRLFLGVLLFFLAFGWLVLFFSTAGLFYTETIVLSILASIFGALWLSLRLENRYFPKFGFNSLLVGLISLAISLATCYFAAPTVFGGRDQGSIATAAIYLSKNHNLKVDLPAAHDLFQKYGPGKALNFPGFDYQKGGTLFSRFPAGYTSYLAASFNLFGLKGIQYANFIPLFLFFVIFWLTLKEFFDEKISFLGFLIAVSFFPFLWFAKYTLTEIYTLFLIWTGIYFLIRYHNAKSRVLVIFSLAPLALSSLVRIEGLIFFFLALVYINLLNKKKIITLPQNFLKYLFIFTILLLAAYLFLNFPALLDSAKNFAKAFLPQTTKESRPSADLYFYLARIFFNYNILPYLLFGLTGIFWLVKKIKKNWAKPEFLPIFIAFPAFFYLISPQITLDDPWLLRRFVFAVFPTLIFYAVYSLEKFFVHRVFLYMSLIVLFASNIAVSARFFTLSENKNLLPQVENISKNFGPDDLILVDRLAAGSGYSLISEPLSTLYNRQAVYFFNADDLKYINQDRYKNIYLLAPLFQEDPWYAELIKNKPPTAGQIITNNFFEPSSEKWSQAANVETKDLVGIWKLN